MKSYLGGGASAKVEAEVVGRAILRGFKMSFVTDAEYRAWTLQNHLLRWRDCRLCGLCNDAPKVVIGRGAYEPVMLVVFAAPSGRAGRTGDPMDDPRVKLFCQVAKKAGIDVDRDLFLTNVVACRTPRGRAPKKAELAACQKKLNHLIERIDPHLIVMAGRQASRMVGQGVLDPGSVSRGEWPCVPALSVKSFYVTHDPDDVLDADSKQSKKRALKRLHSDLKKLARVVSKIDEKIERGGPVDPDWPPKEREHD